jgi:hypothetical protein
MKVKILDVDLIRRFDGVFTNMDLNTAIRYRDQGKVKILDELPNNEFFYIAQDEEGKEVKTKIMENKKIPGPMEPIFPQTMIKL